jgi:pyruvate dehydrogenase E2 component (dihydrolipoamide acetyltransferase)
MHGGDGFMPRVEAGDIVMVVESDKADMDVEAFESGYLAKILVPEGSSAAVGS